MPALSEILEIEPLRLALWGSSGAGKTTLAAMLAMYPELRGEKGIFFADFDQRIGGLRASIPQEYWKYIHGEQFTDSGGIQGSGWQAVLARFISAQREGFGCICIDSQTLMLDLVMNRVMMLGGNRPSNSNPQIQDWMTLTSEVKDAYAKLSSNKKIHIIVTFHEDAEKDEATGRVFKTFAGPPKLSARMPNLFNEIWHCEITTEVGVTKYKVRTRSDHTYFARTAYKTLGTVEDQADVWPKIIEQRTGKRGIPTP